MATRASVWWLLDVMDVICQCMEVRNSSEESQQSQLSALSGCSFNMDSLRRSSISDVSDLLADTPKKNEAVAGSEKLMHRSCFVSCFFAQEPSAGGVFGLSRHSKPE